MPYKNEADRKAACACRRAQETPEQRAQRLAYRIKYNTEHKTERRAYDQSLRMDPEYRKKLSRESAERNRAWRLANPEENLARSRARRESINIRRLADPEFNAVHLAMKREQRRRHRENNRESWQTRKQRERLKPKGWTPEMREAGLLSQGGLCAICLGSYTLVSDHEHCDPPKPRGLLCNNCNAALGFLGDSSATAEAAAAYLRKWGR